MTSNLDGMIDQWLAEEMEASPTRATALGIDGYDDRLGDFSEAGFLTNERRDVQWVARFSAFADAALSSAERVDRDLALSTLRGRMTMHDWQVWRRDPATYLGPCLNGVFTLFLHRSHAEPDLVRFASARLGEVPGLLADATKNLSAELAAPIFVQRALAQCQAGARYARELLPREVTDKKLRASLGEAGARAAEAFDEFGRFLDGLEPRGTHAIGERRYSRLLMDKELLGYGAADMRDRGRAAWEELNAEMQDLAATISGSTDWRSTVEEINQDHPATPDEMRAEYAKWTRDARRFLIEHDLVTLAHGEECLVEPSPPFQRSVLAVASYASPPAFKPSLTGHFFVPFPPEDAPPEEVQRRLASNSYAAMPTIAVHEAYPGHHWHLTWVQGNPRKLRKVLSTPYFNEGWGLYAERVMRKHGFFADPRHDLSHLDARIFRAARIVADTSLHIGDMTFDEAVEFMHTKASLNVSTARAEVGRYCCWPTQAASYLTGSLEIERIRADFDGDDRSFNDAIAGSGMLPIALAQRVLEEAQ